jgi:hypothetical protein
MFIIVVKKFNYTCKKKFDFYSDANAPFVGAYKLFIPCGNLILSVFHLNV